MEGAGGEEREGKMGGGVVRRAYREGKGWGGTTCRGVIAAGGIIFSHFTDNMHGQHIFIFWNRTPQWPSEIEA